MVYAEAACCLGCSKPLHRYEYIRLGKLMSVKTHYLFRRTASDFAQHVVAELEEAIHAVVLYGSVARVQAQQDSDVDVLVVGDDPGLHSRILDAAYAIMEQSHFETFLSVVYFGVEQFQELARRGSPFVTNVLIEGEVLYDDGTVPSIRQ